MIHHWELVGFQHKLLAGHDEALLSPRLILLQMGSNVEHYLTVVAQRVTGDVVFAGIRKEIAVDDSDTAIILSLELQGLVHTLHLVVMRMRLAIRGYESIDTEGPVVGLIPKVSSIIKDLIP